MAILKFVGSVQELSGYRELEASKGITVDQSLRYLNDNGHDGIYDRVANEVFDGRAVAYDSETGAQIGMSDPFREKAVLVPKIAGGNGGGGVSWILIDSTNYAFGTWMSFYWGPPAPSTYTQYPREGSYSYRFATYTMPNGPWTTRSIWQGTGTYPGGIQFAREGFTVQSSTIGQFQVIETTAAHLEAPAIPDYGTIPSANASSGYNATTYRGTGRVSDIIVS
jgi:hypothetical protein